MGGPGSGRRFRFPVRQTVEQFLWIDAQQWWNQEILSGNNTRCHWGWPAETGLRGTRVTIHVRWDRVQLEYMVTNWKGESETLYQWIRLETTPCHFGGERWWFQCPKADCGRRVRRLYRGRYFLCRKCYGLNFHSQHLNRGSRLVRKANKIRMKLGGSAGLLLEDFPNKPKWMHWKTYSNLYETYEMARQASFKELEAWVKNLGGKEKGLR